MSPELSEGRQKTRHSGGMETHERMEGSSVLRNASLPRREILPWIWAFLCRAAAWLRRKERTARRGSAMIMQPRYDRLQKSGEEGWRTS